MSDDRYARAMTADGGIRVIAARTTATTAAAARAQGLDGDAAKQLAELITGAVLLREAMSPGHRVQLILRDADGASVVADSHPDGMNRGVVSAGPEQSDDSGPLLTVCRTLATGALHQGIVSLTENGDISDALMRYMQSSEQIVTSITVGAWTGEGVSMSGGYLVQLLPNAHADVLRQVTEGLESLDSAAVLLAPDGVEGMVDAVCGEVEYTVLGTGPLRFGCNCSRERFVTGIDSLADADIAEIQDAGQPLEVRCEACGQTYEILPTELRGR
jgi:molecular chaperone Hsp33